MGFCLVYRSIFFGFAVTYTLQKSEELPLACLFEVFTGLWLSTPTFSIKDYDYVKRLSVYWFISDKFRVSQKIAKNGEHHIVDFQFKLC